MADDNGSDPDIDDMFDDDDDGYQKVDIPDDTKQNEFIQIASSDPDVFRETIAKIMRDNPDKFNILSVNNDDDNNNNKLTKDIFVNKFNNTFKEELLIKIFESIDIDNNNNGEITINALQLFVNNKQKHPRHQTTKIDSRYLLKTIKSMNFGNLDIDNDNKVTFDEMKQHFKQQNVQDDIVKLVFDEIRQNGKEYITMGDFFRWREKFSATKLHKWKKSHSLNQTVIIGLEELLEEMQNDDNSYNPTDDDDFEMVSSPTDDNDNDNTIKNMDTSTNQQDLLSDILRVLDFDNKTAKNMSNDNKILALTSIIKNSVQKLQYQLADAQFDAIKQKNLINSHKKQLVDTTADARLMKSQVNKHKAATKRISVVLSELIGVNKKATDDPKELRDIISELQNKIGDDNLNYYRALDQIKELKSQNKQLKNERDKLQHELGDAQYAMAKLKTKLTDTLGTNIDTNDPVAITDLVKKLQFQLAEERMDKIHARNKSQQIKNTADRIQYELADERYQHLQLKESIQDLIKLDVNGINNVDDIKDLLFDLQEQLEENFNMKTQNQRKSIKQMDDDLVSKADKNIQNVDMDNAVDMIDYDDDDDIDYKQTADVNKLREIITSLKTELKDSRINHLSVSSTRTHLEVQTFDLTEKLKIKDKQYKKLLRASQQLSGFDIKTLGILDDDDADALPPIMDDDDDDNVDMKFGVDDSDDDGSSDGLIPIVTNTNTNTTIDDKVVDDKDKDDKVDDDDADDDDDDDNISNDGSVLIDDNIVNKETWNGTAAELDRKITKLKTELHTTRSHASHLTQQFQAEQLKSMALKDQVAALQERNKVHARRRSEIFDKIGDDAKNVLTQFEEMEKQKKSSDDKELKLQFLQAEQQRMKIAYDMAKANSHKYKNQKKSLEFKIKSMTGAGHDDKDINKLKNKLIELEEKAKSAQDKELELAFFKAEKQRMDVKFEHQQKTITQTKELNKELQKAAAKEKAARQSFQRKMSTQFGVDDLAKLDAIAKDYKNQLKQQQAIDNTKNNTKDDDDNVSVASDLSGNGNDNDNVDFYNQQINDLKSKLENEQMNKVILEKENQQLMHRLSTAENTHVNKLIQYTSNPITPIANRKDGKNNGNIPPPPQTQTKQQSNSSSASSGDGTSSGDDDDDVTDDSDNDADDDTDDDDDDQSSDNDDDNTNNIHRNISDNINNVNDVNDPMDQIEDLKFKLAEKELQNAQLQRRVSIAGVEKEVLSLLWEAPRVTIQMVSEFIERLPIKHKEKIWSRHANGNFIAKNKILHTLHSFVALCIKIKDRTAVAPSRHDIEKKLVPFADVIRQRTDNAQGMSIDEFNNELHFWILEPVSGLIMTNDEQKQWMDEIDALREELVRVNKEKMIMQRKSQADLTQLLDKMKYLEDNTDDDDPNNDGNDIMRYQQEINSLEQEIISLKTVIQDQNNNIAKINNNYNKLLKEYDLLKQTINKARDSDNIDPDQQDDDDHVPSDDDPDDNNHVPQLIDDAQITSLDDFKNLQTDDAFQEERLEFYQNDANITKNQSYIAWKIKAVNLTKEKTLLEKERKLSVEQINKYKSMVDKLENEKKNHSNQYENQIKSLKDQINKFKEEHQQSEKIRKDSISTLHDSLFAKLLEAEAEHEEMVAKFNKEISLLTKTNNDIQNKLNDISKSKVESIKKLADTIQKLRDDIINLTKQINLLNNKNIKLNNKNKLLNDKTAVQHISQGFSSLFS